MLIHLSDGTYFLTFYNDRARADDVVHWSRLYDRNPLWCTVGWQDGHVLKFAQPEILMYNDEDVKTSAEGNRSSIYAPFIFEAENKVFTVFSNKKTDVQITQIPWSLINGLKQQRTADKIQTEDLFVSVKPKSQKLNSVEHSRKGNSLEFKPLNKEGSFALEFWVRFDHVQPNQSLFDNRNVKGHGIWVGLSDAQKMRIELTDTFYNHEFAQSAEKSIKQGQLHHVLINVDGASHVITILIDGIISGDSPRMNFKQMHPIMGDVNGLSRFYIGTHSPDLVSSKTDLNGEIRQMRIYDHYLTTSQTVANFRAGP
jgi:hypothetical protein